MSGSVKLSYLVPRKLSVNSWSDRVKLEFPLTENMVKLGLDACEESNNEKLKVYLRIKPCQVDFNPYKIFNNTLETEGPNENAAFKKLSKNIGKLINKFHFTTIFSPESTQETVFETSVLSNLKRFIGGRNDLLFAYGTTNAGKTFTMQGTVENPGVIPRAIQFLFKCLEENIESIPRYQPYRYDEVCLLDEEEFRKSLWHKNFILSLNLAKYQRNPELSWRSYKTDTTGASSECFESYENETFREMEKNLDNLNYEVEDDCYSVWISMIEIYNEQIYDLLEVPSERSKLGFAEDENGKVYIKNLRYVQVKNGHEAFQVYEFGKSNLHLGATALNYWSSRSHCICTLTLGRFSKNENSCVALSRFSFCDLAGVERVKKALAVGNRLVESKSINTSLSIFAKCLTAIRENQSNKEKRIIPYRESKLTRLFRDAMMGKETFSIIVNVTPESNLFNESLNVLKFSAVARQIVPANVVHKPKRVKPLGQSRVVNTVSNTNGNCNIDWDGDDAVEVKGDVKPEIEIADLLKLIEELKQQVSDERERADNIESKVRDAYAAKFSELMDLADKQRNLYECENKRIRGVYDRKKDQLMKQYEERERMLKRKRIEEDCPNYVEMETQIANLTNDMELLKSENISLKDLIQQMNAKSNSLQRKCSQLQFELSEKERMLNVYKRSVEDGDPGRDEVVKELENQLLQSKSKNAELKELLDETKFDYKDLLVTNNLIKEENVRLLGDLATTSDAVDDLKRELRDYDKMLSDKTKTIEKLESRLDETKSDVFIVSHVDKNKKVLDIIDLEDSDDELSERDKDEENDSSSDDSVNENSDVECWTDKSRTEVSISGNNKKNGDLTYSMIDGNADEESLVDYEDLLKLVDKLKMEVAEEKERADDAEKRVRKELETKLAEMIEQQIVKERDLFESEKRRMGEAFDRKKVRLIQSYEEKIKNLTDKCNQLADTIKLSHKVFSEVEEGPSEIIDADEEDDEVMCKELTEKILALTQELDTYRKDKVHLEKLLEERKCDCERDKRKYSTFIGNLIKKVEATASIENLNVDTEDNVQLLEEKILKLLENEEINRKEIELLRIENDELKKGLTFKFQLNESSPTEGGRDETVSLEELTQKSPAEEISTTAKENENSAQNGDEDNRETDKDNVGCSVSCGEFLAPPVSDTRNELIEKSTPDRLSREIEKLSLIRSETKKSCKKAVDALDKNIHPSLIKRSQRSRKKGKKQKEAESVESVEGNEEEEGEEELKDGKKERISVRNNKGKKCTKKLFVENDFDDIDLETSFAEPEIPRLRPRKK